MLKIITTELPEGYIGEEYYVQLKSNCNPTVNITWKIEAGGVLPPDLLLSKEGIIFGTPKKTELADFYFVVTNRETGESSGKNLRLTIGSRKPTELKIITDSISDVLVGVPYIFKFECSGGIPPYTWSADDLPAGLSLAENGTISGTAKFSGGTSPFTIKLSDIKNNTTSRFYLINVR